MGADSGPVRTLDVAEPATDQPDYRILVSVANPATCDELIRTGSALAAVNDGELLVLNAVVTDDPENLEMSDSGAESRREVLDTAMAVAEDHGDGVPTRGLLRAAESPATGILDTAEVYDVDCLLLGWHGGRSSDPDAVIGNVVDEVSANTDRDLLVERVGDDLARVESILVPIAGGVHSELAVSTARNLAVATGAGITVGTVVGPGATTEERNSYVTMLEAAVAEVDDVPVETRLLNGESIAETVLNESVNYDLTIMGATGTGSLEDLLFDSVTAQVARGASGRFLIARRAPGRSGSSRVRRLLSLGSSDEGHAGDR